jgi:hypothetical protein
MNSILRGSPKGLAPQDDAVVVISGKKKARLSGPSNVDDDLAKRDQAVLV